MISNSSGDAVYVRRDAEGHIVSLSRVPAADHAEKRFTHEAEVATFVHSLASAQAAFIESDLSMIRAVEDLIDVLIRKEVLRLTDLPDSVQAKLMNRRKLRKSVRTLNLLSDEHGMF